MKAREWLERGTQEQDPIDAFSNYWRGFNNLFFDVGNGSERDKIRNYLSQVIAEEAAADALEHHQAEASYLLTEPVIDMRGNGRNTQPNIIAFSEAATSLNKLQELFMVIYQVRCNLEHGQKSPSRDRDVQLCQSASPFVAYVLGQIA